MDKFDANLQSRAKIVETPISAKRTKARLNRQALLVQQELLYYRSWQRHSTLENLTNLTFSAFFVYVFVKK